MITLQNNKSFTLIEILVTIVIIGILAGVIMISTSSSIDKAHDSTRRQDMGALARGLRAYEAENGSYPALSCRIGTAGCLDNLVPEYFSMLPTDPVSGYYGYSSTGSEFMILAKGADDPITYTDSNGFDGSIVAVSRYYSNFLNKIGQGELNTLYDENDVANGAFWGYVAKLKNGWTGIVNIKQIYGFEIGSYDIYVRIRNDTGGTSSCGVYNEPATLYLMSPRSISGLTNSYQIKYIGRFTLSDANINSDRQWFYFSGDSIYKFIDYVEFRKVN